MNNNYSSDFLSKNNITNIYKDIINQNELINITSDKKQLIINELIKNVKETYKTLDNSKINNKNVNNVRKQFNEICLKKTVNNIKHLLNDDKRDNLHKRKYDRDFNSLNKPLPDIQPFNIRPMMSSDYIPRGNLSMEDRLKEIEDSRKEFMPQQKIPEVPDFLKPIKVGRQKENFDNSANQINIDSSIITPTISGFSSSGSLGGALLNSSGDFASVSFNTQETFDDNMTVEQRLAKMEQERNNNQLPQPPPPPQQLPQQYNQLAHQQPSPLQYNQLENQQIQQYNQPPPQQYNQPPPQQYNQPPPQQYNQPPPQQYNQVENQQFNNDMEIKDLKNTILSLKEKLENLQNNKNINNYVIKYLQLEVNKTESKYTYSFNSINNIIGLNLVSYSLPEPTYNLPNGYIKYNILKDNDETEYIININEGYYDIKSLLEVLNNNDNIVFSLNNKKRLTVKPKITELESENDIIKIIKFKIEENNLVNKLGFIDIENKYDTYLEAINIIDLRLPTKLYLYITNLLNEPYGILNFNNTSKCSITFKNPISLDKLELLFLTENKELYNFENLKYNLSFQMLILENKEYNQYINF
jgi:hypothetical protein